MKKNTLLFTVWLGSLLCAWTQLSAQEVLPFPEPVSASVTGKYLKDSKHQWRKAESHYNGVNKLMMSNVNTANQSRPGTVRDRLPDNLLVLGCGHTNSANKLWSCFI